jgi:hypothetical protein
LAYTLTVLFFIACGIISSWLSFSIAYLMFRSWRTIQRRYLVGVPIGFILLGLGFVTWDLSYVSPPMAFWSLIQLSFSTFGFGIIAASYAFRLRESGRGDPILRFAFLILVVIVTVIVLSLPNFTAYLATDGPFRIGNLIFLGYIIFCLNLVLKAEAELNSVALGFIFLAIDQFSLFLWALNREFLWPLLFAQLMRVAALIILAIFLVRGFQRQ